MNYSHAVAQYRNANETVQKTRQVVLLYDAIIRFLQQAKQAIDEQKYEERLNLLQRASNILIGLQSALDFEQGGEISETLSNFYSAMDLRIMAINRSNKADDLEQIIKEIKIMRDAWFEIDQNTKTEAPAPVVTAEAATGSSDFSA